MTRRALLASVLAGCCLPAWALMPGDETPPGIMLDRGQSAVFRAWMVRIIDTQLARGATPRWVHHDCASLVRFAVNESFKRHDGRWLRAMGMAGELPPELRLTPQQAELAGRWRDISGKAVAYVTALALIQRNSRFIERDVNQAQAGDLLFYDQGDDQHLMVYLGGDVGYHTGSESAGDNGLRRVPIHELLQWKDTRWRPHVSNPNFVGVFRLAFLAP